MRGQNSETKASDNTGKEDGDRKRSTNTEEEDGPKQNREEKQSRVKKHNGDVSKPNEAERAHRKKKIRKCKDTGPEIASTARKGNDGDGREKEDAGVSTPHETGRDHEKEKSRRSTDHKGLGKKQKRRRTDKKHAAPTDTEIGAAMENRLRQLQAPHLDEWLASPRGRIAKELERARRNNTELQLSREAGKTHETIPRPQPSTGFMPDQPNEDEQDESKGAGAGPEAAADTCALARSGSASSGASICEDNMNDYMLTSPRLAKRIHQRGENGQPPAPSAAPPAPEGGESQRNWWRRGAPAGLRGAPAGCTTDAAKMEPVTTFSTRRGRGGRFEGASPGGGADSTPGAAAGDALTHAATMKGEARKPTRAVPEAAQAQAEGQVAGPPMPVVDIARSAAATRQWPHIMAGYKDLGLFLVFLATFSGVVYLQNRPREAFASIAQIKAGVFGADAQLEVAPLHSTPRHPTPDTRRPASSAMAWHH